MFTVQRQLAFTEPPSELDRLRATLEVELLNIDAARASAQAFRDRLESGLFGMTSEDTSVVVFGSLARDEFTGGSDVDWTVLVTARLIQSTSTWHVRCEAS
jgi:UTP:GlnB (protein PII) uridylyltransferase